MASESSKSNADDIREGQIFRALVEVEIRYYGATFEDVACIPFYKGERVQYHDALHSPEEFACMVNEGMIERVKEEV